MLRVTITVSDPWDLGEAIAWQAIRGAVAHMQADAWLVKVDSPFVHSDLEYQYLVVSPRHVSSRLERNLRASRVQHHSYYAGTCFIRCSV
jgi:hypothetical protein